MFTELADAISVDVFNLVCSCLSDRHLLEARLVCRAWNRAILSHLARKHSWSRKTQLIFARQKDFYPIYGIADRQSDNFCDSSSRQRITFSQKYIFDKPFDSVPELVGRFPGATTVVLDFLRLEQEDLNRLANCLKKLPCLKNLVLDNFTFGGDILQVLSGLPPMDLVSILHCEDELYCDPAVRQESRPILQVKCFEYVGSSHDSRFDPAGNKLINYLSIVAESFLEKLFLGVQVDHSIL